MDCLTPKPVFLNHQAALSPGRKYYRKGVLLASVVLNTNTRSETNTVFHTASRLLSFT